MNQNFTNCHTGREQLGYLQELKRLKQLNHLFTIGVTYFRIITNPSEENKIRTFKLGKLITSEPVTLINNGTIVEDNMKKIRLAMEELNMKLREKNIFNLADVEFAIMETDGQLSVLPKSDKKPVTPADMNIQTFTTGLMRDVIIDGKIMEENLKTGGFDYNWLQSQLNMHGIRDASEVFYAGVDNTKKYIYQRRMQGIVKLQVNTGWNNIIIVSA